MLLFFFSQSAVSQNKSIKTETKLTKITFTDKTGKINLAKDQLKNLNSLPKKNQMSDSFQGRVIIFENGCSRTCEGNAGTNETGEWSYNASTCRFSCDGTAGPLKCPSKIINQVNQGSIRNPSPKK